MLSHEYENYHQHLLKKSRLGHIYRNYFLYPLVNQYIKGLTLDIGCGTGEFCSYRQLKKHQETHAADINPFNVEFIKRKGIQAFQIIENKIAVTDSSYENIIMDNVLEHIENPEPTLIEVKRILKSQGRFIVAVPGDLGFKSEIDHKVFYRLSDLTKLIEPQGFKLEHHFYTPFKSDYLDKKMRQYCLYAIFIKGK